MHGRDVSAALVGGASGSLAVSLLNRAGVRPEIAATVVGVAGGLGAVALGGTARRIALGVAATGAGHLALGWLVARAQQAAEARAAAAEAEGGSAGIRAAMERARQEIEEERQGEARPEVVAERCADVGRVDEDGVAAADNQGGGEVSSVPVGVGDPECGGARVAAADGAGAAADAALHGRRAGSLCRCEGGAVRSRAEWDAWRERGAR
jgi:hypothetical protein